MAIPIAQETIEPQATQATTPEELHPVAAAFGGDIGAALEKGGSEIASRVQTLSLHMARMNYYRGEAQRADLVNQYKTGLQTQLYGDPGDPNATTTYTPDANTKGLTLTQGQPSDISNTSPLAEPIERPLGVYNWKDNMAHGALDYIDQWHQQTTGKIMQQAQGLGLRNGAILKTQLDNAWSSERFGIVKHESDQIEQAQIKTYMTGAQLDADNAVTKQDPISLGRTIDSINQNVDSLIGSQHLDPNSDEAQQISELQKNKFQTMALNNSMMANLRTNFGDSTQFQGILDKLHEDGKINDTVYENAGEHLDRASKAIISQNATAAKMQTVNVRMDAFNKIGQGKFNINDQSLIDDYASKDPELGNALQTVAESRGQYKPERNDAQNREYQKSVTNMINSSSQDQLSGYLAKSLSNKDGLSQTHMNILVNALMNHAKTLPVIDGQPNSPVTQDLASSSFNALNDWADKADLKPEEKTDLINHYLEGMSKNGAPKDNYDRAIMNHMVSVYPALANKDAENIPTDIDGKSQGFNKAVNFAQGTSQAKAQKFLDRRLEATKKESTESTKETPGQAIDKLLGKDNG